MTVIFKCVVCDSEVAVLEPDGEPRVDVRLIVCHPCISTQPVEPSIEERNYDELCSQLH